MRPILALSALVAAAAPAAAQQEPVPAAEARAAEQGPAEATPQSVPPHGYRSPAGIHRRIREWERQGRCAVTAVAESPAGEEVLVATFGARADLGRPAILVLADPDGDRPGAAQLALALGEHLAQGADLLEHATVHLVPVPNPDASARAFAGLAPRRGKPVDEDRDGRLDEDSPQDLDGDGRVLWMRRPDPAGGWRLDEADPRATVKADRKQGESGGWELQREGQDDDGDREVNEDDAGGTRYEANWPHRYAAHGPGCGDYALSEPETRGLARFVLDHPEIAVVLVLGSEDNLVDPPDGSDSAGADSTEPLEEDAALLQQLAERLYEGVDQKPRGADHGRGNFADWAYFQAGALVLESAVWSPALDAPEPEADPAAPAGEADPGDGDPEEANTGKDPVLVGKRDQSQPGDRAQAEDLSDEAKLLAWNDRVLGGAGFVAWEAFEHPELGVIELGGWLPLVRENPPAEELPALAERYAAFLDSLADDLPRLSWEKLEVERRGGDVFEVRAVLVNDGRLPTHAGMASRTRRHRPIKITLAAPEGGALLAGRSPQLVDRLPGLGGHEEFRWVLRLPAGGQAQLTAESESAGVARAEIQGER